MRSPSNAQTRISLRQLVDLMEELVVMSLPIVGTRCKADIGHEGETTDRI